MGLFDYVCLTGGYQSRESLYKTLQAFMLIQIIIYNLKLKKITENPIEFHTLLKNKILIVLRL